jgi:hypothetical protein
MTGLVAFAADIDKKEKRSRKALLEKYDTNKDGKLDKSERKAARSDRRKASDSNKPADANKSGDQPQKDK